MPSQIFAKLGTIKGESTDAKHPNEIEVLSFSWGVTNSATVGGGGGAAPAGRPFRTCPSFTRSTRRRRCS